MKLKIPNILTIGRIVLVPIFIFAFYLPGFLGDLIPFIFICVVTRGLRFFLVAYLTYKFGSRFGTFLEKKGGQWAAVIAVIIIVIAAGIYFHIF